MKKLLPIVLILLSLNLVAQNGKRDRIKALKIAFITERIDLTEKQAQQFWPIYNEHENNISQIRYKDIRSIRKEIRDNINTMSEEKAKTLLDNLNEAETKMHNLNIAFSNKISGIISPKKIILLKVAEEDFKRKMLDEFKRRERR